MVKGIFFILFGLCIDGLQVLIGLACTALGALAGSLGGAAAAYAVCAKTGSTTLAKGCAFIGGALGSFANPAIAPFAIPILTVVGFMLGVLISLTLGSTLVCLLAFDGMFYPSFVWPAYIGEAIPGLDWIPAWTFLAVRSVLRKKAETGTGLLAAGAGVATAVTAAKVGNIPGAIRQATNLGVGRSAANDEQYRRVA